MPKPSPGARERGLGATLRRLREDRGLSQREAADLLHWGKDRLSRLENGRQNVTVEDVAQILGAYSVENNVKESILDAARSVDEPGWWERIPGITRNSAVLADYETEAIELVDWGPALIPGLLQTMDYAAAAMTMYGISDDVIGPRIAARRKRQQAVTGTPYTAYLGMAALRAQVGGPAVLAAQLDSLLSRRDASIRVVPETPAHLGQLGGFLRLRFEDAPTVVHVELLGSGVFHDTPELTRLYDLAVTQIEAVALGETQSARVIAQIREETKG